MCNQQAVIIILESMITLTFDYQQTSYLAIVREKYFAYGKEYHVTIMNGELEKLLYGDHIIPEKDGSIEIPPECPEEKKELLSEIKKGLTKYLLQDNIRSSH
jgi:hypothetical protein